MNKKEGKVLVEIEVNRSAPSFLSPRSTGQGIRSADTMLARILGISSRCKLNVPAPAVRPVGICGPTEG